MKLFSRTKLLLLAAGWAFALLHVQAAQTGLIAFELESHDKQDYNEKSWTGRPLMFFVSTREAAAHNTDQVWSGPLAATVTATARDVVLVRVGTLPRGVPRLFAGMVRDALAPGAADPVRISLLDWEALFVQSYGLPSDAYNVLLFDRDGKLAYSTALYTFSQAQLDSELSALRTIAADL